MGKFSVGFTKFLLLSSSAFLALMLPIENAETLGPLNVSSFLTTGAGGGVALIVGVVAGAVIVSSELTVGAVFLTSAIE